MTRRGKADTILECKAEVIRCELNFVIPAKELTYSCGRTQIIMLDALNCYSIGGHLDRTHFQH